MSAQVHPMSSKRRLDESAHAPRVGGRKQRFSIAESVAKSSRPSQEPFDDPAAHSDGFDSELAKHLLKEWSWGHLSATKVQQSAFKSYVDQVALLDKFGISRDTTSRSLERLAKLGSWGKHEGNCHTELHTYLGEPGIPKALFHDVPLTIPKRNKLDDVDADAVEKIVPTKKYPILLPHVMFAHYYSTDKDRFNELYLGDCQSPEKLAEFWETLVDRGDPRLKGHPMCKRKIGRGLWCLFHFTVMVFLF